MYFGTLDVTRTFSSLVDDAIQLNRDHRELQYVKDTVNNLSPAQFLMEFGTVAVNIGRRTGKTSYIIDNALSKDLIIVSSMDIARNIKRLTNATVIVSNGEIGLKHNIKPHARFDVIYLDEPTMIFSKISKNYLYDFLAVDCDQLFVLLGA